MSKIDDNCKIEGNAICTKDCEYYNECFEELPKEKKMCDIDETITSIADIMLQMTLMIELHEKRINELETLIEHIRVNYKLEEQEFP